MYSARTFVVATLNNAVNAICYHRGAPSGRLLENSTIVPTALPRSLRRASSRVCQALVVALSVTAYCALAATPDETGIVRRDNGEFTINLRDADIRAFISSVADITGTNFVVDPRVKGNVTVISSAPTDAKALYDVFLSILKVHGFAAIPSGDVVKIVPDATAKQEGQDTSASYVARDNDSLVTAVIPVRHVSAPELVAVLRPLLPQEAHLAGFAASNLLVVADSGVNVKRIMHLVAQLDTQSNKITQLYELKNAEAEDVVRVMNSLSGEPGKQQSPGVSSPQFIAYGRTNTVLIQAAPNEIANYRHLIDALDVPDRGPDSVEVIPLRFATAADLMPVLQGVLSGESAAPHESGSSGGRGNALRPEGIAPPSATATPGSSNIQADEATNTLIIQAPARQLKMLHEVIAKLDVRRNQVLVEGIIAELSTRRNSELGIQWRSNQPNTGVFAGTQLPGEVSNGIEGAVKKGSVALLNGFTLGYLEGGDIRALLRAFSGDGYTNILSTPTLMTLDNAEAEIVVGQNVPFVTGSFTNNTTTPESPFQTIERKDVGILLKVKPQINEGGTVTLELEQEVSSVAPSTRGSDLITDKRSIKTTVLVDDGEIVVLGGLLENKLTETDQKIPWLGDIPVLGHLFKNAQNDHTKSNLMVFLRPTVISDRESNRDTAAVRYDLMRTRQEAQEPHRKGNLLRENAPHMPAPDGLLE